MRNTSEIHPSWALWLVVLLGAAVHSVHAAAAKDAPALPLFPRRIQQFIQQKCGNNGAAVWVYEGALYDPLDGHKIANVEGLELVRKLADSSSNAVQRSKQLQAFNLTKDADYSATLLSRRLFCYQSPQQPRRLLDSIRLRPNAPLRKIPVHQAVSVYDSATTYVTLGDSLLLHTEWPNTKCTWGIATTTTTLENNNKKKKKHSDSLFDFNVFVKPNSPYVPNLSTLSSSTSSSKDVVVAPKRLQLIQFGTTSSQQQQQAATNHQGKFGVRETYSYSTDSSPTNTNTALSRPRDWLDRLLGTTPPEQVSVKYTRYGEGPPWYGAGKYCMLELQGRRVASVQEAPPLAASIAAERVPGFLSVHAPILSDASAQRAMEWFRRQGHLQLSDEHVVVEQEEEMPNGRLGRLAFHVTQTSAKVLSKVKAASTLEPSSGE